MGRRFARLNCEFVRGPSRSYTYAFDLVVEDEKVVAGWEYLGFSIFKDKDNRGATETFPFIIDKDGEMDFGSGFGDAERYIKTNILTKSVRIGENFTIWDGGENVYVIREINTA